MQKTKAGGMPTQSDSRDETHRAVVADLASVIDHVQRSVSLIEQAVASESDAEDAIADNAIVLGDVTPGYARVDAALRECDARLGLALRLPQGPMSLGDTAGDGRLPAAHWPISA